MRANNTLSIIHTFFSYPGKKLTWLIIFLLSLVYLFFRADKDQRRAMIFAFLAFFLFFNDFTFKLFTKIGENLTFYRHLWIIPYMTIVGLAVFDLAKRLPNMILKVLLIAAVCLLPILTEGINPFLTNSFNTILNPLIVSRDTEQLGEELTQLQKETEKTLFVVAPDELNPELLMFNGNISFNASSIIDSSKTSGQSALTSETPDVDYILSLCCAKGMDYVIVSRTENTEAVFREKGFEPVFRSDSYLLSPACPGGN